MGRTLRQVQPTGIETQYEYNALGEVLKVTDAEGHETLSTYDLLGRRTQLTHPDAGTTTLAYDNAGNLIRRQTAQIREQMPDAAIEYQYSYNRLQEIQYPKHPENNVRYHYGKQSESPLRRGRLWLVEDASGGTEYFYGNMGEVTKEIRSIRITPTEVQTYITEYAYDTWNRIQHMTYPDGEILDFGYNRAGQLTSLTGKKGKYEYTYLKQQGYDEFEQKVYRLYGNGTETSYTYDATMRRLANLKAQSGTYVFQNNRYTYDLVGNILQVANQVPIINYALGGASSYNYSYDELNRLVIAKGTYTGEANSAEYQLQMQYNRLNGIVQKALTHKQNGKDKSYTLDYTYDNPKHPHALSILKDTTTPKPRVYEYDGNGNPIAYQGFKDFRLMVWDEENRLQGINDNGKLHLYTYDHTGERAVKSSAESQSVLTNGQTSAVIAHTENYTAYINPYFVVNKGKFTKHYFEGTSRIVSKLGEGTFQQPSGLTAGGIDYIKQSAKQQEALDNYIRNLNVPPGPPTQQGIYASPEWTGKDYPSISWSDISQDQEPPEGWPRPPKFNEPGDVPGPPVQYGDPIKPETAEGGFGFKDNGVEEKNLYFYHPDHLGSSSYITDRIGKISQHTEYIAFGEVLFDEHTTETNMPYLFNGKELDSETGLYYYGARYYDARVSLWLNVDPLADFNPFYNSEHYIDGQHNRGIYNPNNLNPYIYCYQSPSMYTDPNGKQGVPGAVLGAFTEYASIVGERMLFQDMSFKDANKAMTMRDGVNIGVAAGFGALSGTAKFAKWAGSSTGRKILVKMLEIGIDALEDIIKQYVEKKDVDLKQTLISSLTSFGMGHILKGTSLQKYISKQEKRISRAESKISKIQSGVGTVGGKAKKIRTQKAIIKNAQNEINTYKGVNNIINKSTSTGVNTLTTGAYKNNKSNDK
nr:RHS repeat-associated core domain-containing protein [Ornithobacterium rhinotracheale]